MVKIFSSRSGFAEFHFAPQPALLPVWKDDKGGIERLSLNKLLETRCPSFFKRYQPPLWLTNGHVQTIYCIMGNFSAEDQVWYRRTYLRLADGGTLGLDFTPAEGTMVKSDAPIIVIQHGLSGGSHEPYIRAILSRACSPTDEGGLGYRAVVINFRGCAGVPLTSPLFYSAGATDDTRQALMYISHMYPDAPLLGLGFSLGSNVLTRYLAEEGSDSRLQSACILACPWDLKQNGDSLDQSLIGKHLWLKGMGRNMQALVKRHSKVLLDGSNGEVTKATEATLNLKNPTLDEFDTTFTAIAGGSSSPFPFPDAASYYIWVSSHNVLGKIRVPFLALNAGDDPVVNHVPRDCGDNGMVVLGLTACGGHLGWFQSANSTDRWTTKPVLEWLQMVGQDLAFDPTPRGSSLYIADDGFLRDQDNTRLGCKAIEGGGLIDGNAGEQDTFTGL
ncbi:hypothetical protein HYPSUDRAFT_133302 [Hypholoma sublateritium FD-334 SS-4]|uniref:AB hydrolase-1 domain-containing protein n=1 Tax=Hypholoma sublateritium (strain FD-334 SS-4) TaxID=945553 RepID=A0A0D2Q3W7_HYPSF|nr:hypothetical protein HYPSUDRAFT_133302 [Hypholoma sublateritium FD-334 SS-4]